MYPAAVEYHRATSVEDAIRALVEAGPDARVLAGGQSLVAMMKLRIAAPTALIDISGLHDLSQVVTTDTSVSIGALVTHHRAGTEAAQVSGWRSLADVSNTLGDRQIRNVGTIVGALAHADPSGDWPAVAVAQDAVVEVEGQQGRRRLPAATLFRSAFTTAIGPSELITSVNLPVRPTSVGSAYYKISDPASGYARVGVAVVLDGSSGSTSRTRVVATGVAGRPVRLREVELALGDSFDPSRAVARVGADLVADDIGVTDPYHRQLLTVATERAIVLAGRRSAADPCNR